MPPLVCRIRIGSRPDGIVVIARIFGIDGDKREPAQIGAPGKSRRLRTFGFRQRFLRKFRWYSMLVDCDETDRAGLVHAAQPLDHARTRLAGTAAGEGLDQNQLVRLRAAFVVAVDSKFMARFAVDGLDTALARMLAIDAEHAM